MMKEMKIKYNPMSNLKNTLKRLSLVCAAFIGITFAGCDLDVVPPTTIAPEFYWTSESDAKSFLNTIYAASRSSSSTCMYLDVYSDDVYNRHAHESSGYLFVKDGLTSDAEKLENMYKWDFVNIRHVNLFLKNIDQVPMSETVKERMKLEARFWRAYDYLFKTIAWGKVPLFGDEVFEYDVPTISRNTQADVYDYIIKEAKACYDDLPPSYSGADFGRVTKWAARALQARAELYAGRYADAAATAKDIIDNGGFSLKKVNSILDQKEYEEMDQFVDWNALNIDKEKFMKGVYSYGAVWTQEAGNPEYILTRQYMNADGFTDAARYMYIRAAQCNTSDGWSSLTPTQNLVDAYWTADGKKFTPPAQSTRVTNFNAMDGEWIADNEATNISVKDWTDERLADGRLKNYPYMQEFRNRDARLYASILFSFKSWNQSDVGDFTYRFRHRQAPNEQNNESKTGFSWRKLTVLEPASSDPYAADTDFPVYRLAEILLIYAEATTEATGYDATVAAELNKLRDRAGMPDVPASFGSKAEALDFIRRERRIELAGEGRRAEDVARYDEQYWKDHMDVGAVWAPNGAKVQDMSWGSRMRLKPIPINAMDLNPGLKGDQNPGYN